MGVFNLQARMTRLGSQTFQPLGVWPIAREGGSFGASGSVQPAVALTGASQSYARRASTASDIEPLRGDSLRPGLNLK